MNQSIIQQDNQTGDVTLADVIDGIAKKGGYKVQGKNGKRKFTQIPDPTGASTNKKIKTTTAQQSTAIFNYLSDVVAKIRNVSPESVDSYAVIKLRYFLTKVTEGKSFDEIKQLGSLAFDSKRNEYVFSGIGMTAPNARSRQAQKIKFISLLPKISSLFKMLSLQGKKTGTNPSEEAYRDERDNKSDIEPTPEAVLPSESDAGLTSNSEIETIVALEEQPDEDLADEGHENESLEEFESAEEGIEEEFDPADASEQSGEHEGKVFVLTKTEGRWINENIPSVVEMRNLDSLIKQYNDMSPEERVAEKARLTQKNVPDCEYDICFIDNIASLYESLQQAADLSSRGIVASENTDVLTNYFLANLNALKTEPRTRLPLAYIKEILENKLRLQKDAAQEMGATNALTAQEQTHNVESSAPKPRLVYVQMPKQEKAGNLIYTQSPAMQKQMVDYDFDTKTTSVLLPKDWLDDIENAADKAFNTNDAEPTPTARVVYMYKENTREIFQPQGHMYWTSTVSTNVTPIYNQAPVSAKQQDALRA